MSETSRSGDVIVVKDDRRAVHVIGAVLVALVGSGWWALYAFVEVTPENRIAGHVVGGGMTAVFLGLWLYEILYPARLEISHPTIVQKRKGRHRSITLQRTTGELAFGVKSMVVGGHGSVTPVLMIPDDPQQPIAIATYDRKKIKEACEVVGWRFTE
ncbi:MAG: hypothetical protein ACLGIB_01640 [Actinomycetota bacterium]